MSYPSYPPYGQPPPQQGGYYQQQPPQGQYYQQPGQYPPPQQGGYYQQPPPNQYGSPAPPAAAYGVPPQSYPPQQQPYGAAPPQPYGATPQPYAAPYGSPPPGQYGQAAPPQGYPAQPYGAPPSQPYGSYPAQQYAPVPPTPPSIGYGPPQIISWNGVPDATELRHSLKGFHTHDKKLNIINIMANKDPLQMATLRDTYHRLHQRQLEHDIKEHTSHHFEQGLLAIERGPLQHDVHLIHSAIEGIGTNEAVLDDVVLGRSNADLNAIKSAYHQTYFRNLVQRIESEESFGEKRHFAIILQAVRAEDAMPVNRAEVDRDVDDIYRAIETRVVMEKTKVCSILSVRNDNHIRAVGYEYEQKYGKKLENVIHHEFALHPHMRASLLYQLRHAMDKYMHQAELLEECMPAMMTHDKLLIERIVRLHWDPTNLANVKAAYLKRHGHSLAHKLKQKISGDFLHLMLACIGEPV